MTGPPDPPSRKNQRKRLAEEQAKRAPEDVWKARALRANAEIFQLRAVLQAALNHISDDDISGAYRILTTAISPTERERDGMDGMA